MASLLRFSALSARRACSAVKNLPRKCCTDKIFRTISTSNKNKDVTAVTGPMERKEPWQVEVEKEVEAETKNWLSYGYSFKDRDEDTWAHHVVMFFGFTLTLLGGSFIIAYQPDQHLQDWASREAYLELERREAAGLPLVDPDYIPADSIELPPEEELEGVEIII